MEHLTNSRVEKLKQLMQQRRRQLDGQIKEVLARTDERFCGTLADVPDVGDRSVAHLLIDLDHASVHRKVEEIRNIEASLARLEQDTYGTCLDCGVEIDFDRLQVFPTASRCRICQAVYEKNHADGGTPSL